MEKRCYKVKELQEILGLSRTSIYELLKRKEFQCVVVGGKYIISRDHGFHFERKFDLIIAAKCRIIRL